MRKQFLAAAFLLLSCVYADAASRFLICATTCTIDSSNTLIWSATSGGATGASVPGSADTVTLDANTCVGGTTCTATMNFGGTWTIQSFTMGACTASTTGCIFDNSVNNNNITLSLSGIALSLTGTGTRNVKLGSATYTLSGADATYTASTITNLTFSGASSTIRFSGAGDRTFTSGGASLTYGTLVIDAASGAGTISVGNSTVTTTTVAAPNYINITQGQNFNGGVITLSGSSGSFIGIGATSPTATATLTASGGSSMSWIAPNQIIFVGSPTVSNCMNLGTTNSGITCNFTGTPIGGMLFGK